MAGIESSALDHHHPQDPGILVDHRHDSLLPANAGGELNELPRDPVLPLSSRHRGRLCTLDQPRTQVVVAALRDAREARLAAGGVLAGRYAEPGAELADVDELREVARASART